MAEGNAAVREASAVIRKQGFSGVTPRQLMAAAKEVGKDISETLDLVGDLLDAGQGEGPAPETERAMKGKR